MNSYLKKEMDEEIKRKRCKIFIAGRIGKI
jgi:hypothetical protein